MEVLAFFVILILCIAGFIFSPTVIRVVAHLAITKEALEKLRRAIGEACSNFDMGTMAPADAEDELAERARHAIGRTLAEINPKQPVEVTQSWPPEQRVIITGDIAVIAPSIGVLLLGPHSRIEPITVRVKRAGVVKLDNRPPIAAVHAAIYEPPVKKAVGAKPAAAPPVNAPQGPTGKAMPVRRK